VLGSLPSPRSGPSEPPLPRQARRDAPDLFHHVVLRGIDRQRIFVDDVDRRDLLARLDRILPLLGVVCLAWALVPNHVHLLLRTTSHPLSAAILRIATGYAGRFNRRHGRVGYLFQNRYWSEPILDDTHLRVLVVYVHRNPVKAGMVDLTGLARFPWTGHAALMGAPAWAFHDVGGALDLFGGGRDGRRNLRAWMRRGAADPERRRVAADPAVDAAIAAAARDAGVSVEEVLAGSRRAPACAARRRIIEVACRELGLPQARVAELLRISPAAVSRSRRSGRGVSPSSTK
jgi:REP element-mobilizing transposase RayT